VSSSKHTKVGDDLSSQERRCREFAHEQDLQVIETFADEAGGSQTGRSGIEAMLSFLRQHRSKEPIVVIAEDISRLAGGVEAHLRLRATIGEAGGILRSAAPAFRENPIADGNTAASEGFPPNFLCCSECGMPIRALFALLRNTEDLSDTTELQRTDSHV
jgi:hypothetical protein